MTHSFQLTHPERETSPVRLVVSHRGKIWRKATGISVNTKFYNPKGKTVRSRFKDLAVSEELTAIENRLLQREKPLMSFQEVEEAMTYGLGGGVAVVPTARPTFWEYFREFAERECPSKKWRANAYRVASSFMGKKDDWEEIDGDWHFRLDALMKKAGYSLNYISTITSKVRTVMHEGEIRGYHTNTAYKSFPRRYETSDTVYLDRGEMEDLWELDLTDETERKARDLFFLGYYTAARYQNYSRLSLDNISGGKIRFIQPKTGGEVVMPCAPRVMEILRRWGGKAPALTEQAINRALKDICRKAGFTSKVQTRITKGGKTVISTHEKWELISTHTARRSGATNLYLEGVPIRICRFLTGHKDDATFLKYIKVSREEGADLLAKADFFK